MQLETQRDSRAAKEAPSEVGARLYDESSRYFLFFARDYAGLFPNNTQQEKHLFDLQRRAYVGARYSKVNQITREDLEAIAERVRKMRETTDRVCRDRTEELGKTEV